MRRRESGFRRFLKVAMLVLCDLMFLNVIVFFVLFYFYPGSDYGLPAFLVTMAFAILGIVFVTRLLWRELRLERTSASPGWAEMYLKLRGLAFEMPPPANASENEPYAVIMDMGLDQTVVTLVSTSAGDASLYFSNGGGIVGGIGHAPVRKAAKKFVAHSGQFLDKMQMTTANPFPKTGEVRFCCLTKAVKYEGTDSLANAAGEPSPYGPFEFSPFESLFMSAQDVITELRQIAE